MKRALVFALAGILLAVVASCGGGRPVTNGNGEDDDYGAVGHYLSDTCQYVVAAISTGDSSEMDAEAGVHALCNVDLREEGNTGSQCKVHTFRQCGAVVVGQRGSLCYASNFEGNPLAALRSAALQRCRTQLGSGAECEVLLSLCNSDPGSLGLTWRPSQGPVATQHGGIAWAFAEECDFAVASITTRQSSSSAAETAARQRCASEAARQAGSDAPPTCTTGVFPRCAAVAIGYNTTTTPRRCAQRAASANTVSEARSGALQRCRSELGSGADCEVQIEACSADAAPSTDVWRPSNRPPRAGSDLTRTMDINEVWRWTREQWEAAFSDPDGDMLTYTARSSSRAVATVVLPALGGLQISSHAEGSATISITATDPGGLSATLRIRVTVNLPPKIYGAIAWDRTRADNCEPGAGIVRGGARTQAEARRAAIAGCVLGGGTTSDCGANVLEYGAGHGGNRECGALARGITSATFQPYVCLYEGGVGSSQGLAEADALNRCRTSRGFSNVNCTIPTTNSGGRFSECLR